MKLPWFRTICEILNYKLDEVKDKAREVFARLITDYERTGSLEKFIAVQQGGLTKDLSEWEEDLSGAEISSRITCINAGQKAGRYTSGDVLGEKKIKEFIEKLIKSDNGLEKITEEFCSKKQPDLTPDDKWLEDLKKLNNRYRKIGENFEKGKIDFETYFQDTYEVTERYLFLLGMDDEIKSRFYSSALSVDEVTITREYH